MTREKLTMENEIASRLIALSSAHDMILNSKGEIECVKGVLLTDSELALKYDKGQTDISSHQYVKAIASEHLTSFALLEDGTVKYAGEEFSGIRKTSDFTDLTDIACGQSHFVGRKIDGTVVACGENDYGQCNVSKWTDVEQIFAYFVNTYAIRSDGTVLACGKNDKGQCNVSGWKNIVNMYISMDYAIGIRADGELEFCGKVPDYIKEKTANWSNIISIAGEDTKLIALKDDGTAICCCEDCDENLTSSWTDLVAVFGDLSIFIGIQRDGRILAVSNDKFSTTDKTKNYHNKRLFECIETFYDELVENFDKAKAEAIQNANKKAKKQKITDAITATIVLAIIASLLTFVIMYFVKIKPNSENAESYTKAVEFAENGYYRTAYSMFLDLGDYEDSIEQCKKYQWYDYNVGDTIYFGNYEQDNKTENSMEDLEWIVLDKSEDGTQALIITEKIIDTQPYQDIATYSEMKKTYLSYQINWHTSSLREWLNSDFISTAFDEQQQNQILKTHTHTVNKEEMSDNVFLLSNKTADTIFKTDSDREAKRTAYAKGKGLKTNYWWLYTGNSEHGVGPDGSIWTNGRYKNFWGSYVDVDYFDSYGVRPVMWINIENAEEAQNISETVE